MTTQSNTRGFTSNIGAILAAAGGAVGLGNIWRFPYTLGNNGGGAFLLVYVFFVLLIGIPLMMTEFIIGRRSQKDPIGAYRTLAPKHKGWMLIGIFNILGALLIYAFYSVVAGWTLNYVVLSCGNQLGGCDLKWHWRVPFLMFVWFGWMKPLRTIGIWLSKK